MNIKDFILGYVIGKGDGGGGSSVDIEPLSATQNGEYSEEGVAYSPVTVDVPNSYSAGDEGKVVSNGALVSQTSDTVTQNGTVDTTLINSLLVNVSDGGASNFVTGTFTVPATEDSIETVDTGYTGNGYPLAVIINVDGGMYNPNDNSWYSTAMRYAVGQFSLTKCIFGTAPVYGSSYNANDTCSLSVAYKNNATDATSYGQIFSKNALFFSGDDPGAQVVAVVVMTDKKTIKYRTRSSGGYGLGNGITYRYWIVYSE